MNPAQLNLNPLTQIDPVLIAATVLIFLATYFALRRVFVMPFVVVMEQRERHFEEAAATIADAEEIERVAAEEAERVFDEAARAAEEVRTETRDRAEDYRRSRIETATQEASARLEAGRAEIAAARAAHAEKLRVQVVDCVGLACERMLGSSDPVVVEAAVDRLMARRMD